MISLVRKTLQIYLNEKRIPTQADFTAEELRYTASKDPVFVTLYHEGKVIASAGRIQCQKENSLSEAIDITLLTLKDTRFAEALQNPASLDTIKVRTDRITPTSRRMLKSISELNVRSEGIIFLSQNYGVMSVILPQMISEDPTPERYFDIACKKADLDPTKLTHKDYVIYGLTTEQENDFV